MFGQKKKQLSPEELNTKIENTQAMLSGFATKTADEMTEIKKVMTDVRHQLEDFKEVRGMTPDMERTIRQMKNYYSDLPEMSVIYRVLLAYIGLNKTVAEKKQEGVRQHFAKMKQEIVAKNVHNCAKCKKPLEEGEFYRLNGEAFCLEHMNEGTPQAGPATEDESL